MATNGVNSTEDEDMATCHGDKVVTMMDVLQEQEEFEEDANAVLGASDDQNCTYTKGYVKRQAIYACLTCCPDAKTDQTKRAGVCLACSLHCHENHELVELYTKRNFRCDCGNPKFNSTCQFTPNKSDLNYENKYNQNFMGQYCTCHRPYPDPEATDEEEMIQCIVCEDWLHCTHLEATVPLNDQYAEMICKECMEEYDFLHDYGHFAINVKDKEIVNDDLDFDIDVTSYKSKRSAKISSAETKSKISPKENSKEMEEANSSKSDTKEGDSINENVTNNGNKGMEIEKPFDLHDNNEENSVKQEKANGNEKDISSEQHDKKKSETEKTVEACDKVEIEKVSDENGINKEDIVEDKISDCKANSEEIDVNTPMESVKTDNINEKENLEENNINIDSESKQVNESDSISKDKGSTRDHAECEENKENTLENETSQDIIPDTFGEMDTNDKASEIKTNNESLEQLEENKLLEDELETKDNGVSETDESEITNEQSVQNCEIKTTDSLLTSNVDTKNTSASTDNNAMDVEMRDEVKQNDTEGHSKENKRRLDDEGDNMEIKRQKKDTKDCVRPRKVKKMFKGATFWSSNFRQILCTCNECLSMYKDLAVLFLVDSEDTVTAYEALGKERTEGGPSTQYEKGLQALSSLDRVQQINALTEYNKMRDKLLDFLKSFKDRKEIVKEEDIKAFFAGMKPKREPDGVYFCR